MTDQITLPRAELQAALDALDKWYVHPNEAAIMTTLRSRLAEPSLSVEAVEDSNAAFEDWTRTIPDDDSDNNWGAWCVHHGRDGHDEAARLAFAAGRASVGIVASVAAPASPVVPDGWKEITAHGQVKAGDKLRFKIGDEKFAETAKVILRPDTAKEEIVYNRRKHYYIITSLAIAGNGGQKSVEFLSVPSQESTK